MREKLPKTIALVRDFTQEGEGVAQLQSEAEELDGRIVFIPDTVPGDLLAIDEVYSEGRKTQVSAYHILEPFAQRQEPFCRHFGTCGACQLQSVNYAANLKWKTKRVADVLERVAGLEPEFVKGIIRPCLGMEEPYRYRSIVRYSLSVDGKLGFYTKQGQVEAKKRELGVSRKRSRRTENLLDSAIEVLGLEECLIQTEEFNLFRDYLNSSLGDIPKSEIAKLSTVEMRQNKERSAYMLVFHFNEEALESPYPEDWQELFEKFILYFNKKYPEVILSLFLDIMGEFVQVCGDEKLRTCENEVELAFAPQAFQQTNLRQNEVLYSEIVKAVKSAQSAEIVKKQATFKILELYCGSGSLSLQIANALPKAEILGIELVPEAIEDAKANAHANNLSQNTNFVVGDAQSFFLQEGKRVEYDLILVDPPRQGLEKKLSQAITESNIPYLLYVSCDPAALARDLKILTKQYRIISAQPIDMFPWTTHVETVVLMSRKSLIPSGLGD